MNKRFLSIKKQTRLALPEDDAYLYRLGIALCGFNSINGFMIEIICHIDDKQNQTKLFELESGKVLDEFRKTLSYTKKNKLFPIIYLDMSKTADLFEDLNTERSDFIHSYPITNKKNEQILHRRKESKGKYFEVDNDFLDSFIIRLHDVGSLLYKIRSAVKPYL